MKTYIITDTDGNPVVSIEASPDADYISLEAFRSRASIKIDALLGILNRILVENNSIEEKEDENNAH